MMVDNKELKMSENLFDAVIDKQLQKWVSILVKIIGVLTLIAVIVNALALVIEILEYDNRSRGVAYIGVGIAILVIITVVVTLAKLFWDRANRISTLDGESHLVLMMFIIIGRLLGEGLFILFIGQGIIGFILGVMHQFLEYFRLSLPEYIEHFESVRSLYEGVQMLIILVFAGTFLLIAHYFLAGLVNLLVDMATNLKKIETRLSIEEGTSDS